MYTETKEKIFLSILASVCFKNKEMELHVKKKIFCFNLNKHFLLCIFKKIIMVVINICSPQFNFQRFAEHLWRNI